MALDNNYNGLTTLKDWWGKVKANFTYLDNRISTIITTPAEGVTAQEIIDARKGETALGDKIDAMDAAHASHEAEKASEEALGHIKVPSENIDENGLIIFPSGNSGVNPKIAIDVTNPPTPLVAAIGDDITDDTMAIQGIVDYIYTTYGVGCLLFPPLTYKITDTIKFYDNIEFEGIGKASVIKMYGAKTILESATKGVTAVYHPAFTKLYLFNSEPRLEGSIGLDLTDVSYAQIDRCRVRYQEKGIVLGGNVAGYYNEFYSCEIASNTTGFYFGASANSNKIFGGRVLSNVVGVDLNTCTDIFISTAFEKNETGIHAHNGCQGVGIFTSRFEANGVTLGTSTEIPNKGAIICDVGVFNVNGYGNYFSSGSDKVLDYDGRNNINGHGSGICGNSQSSTYNIAPNPTLDIDSNADGYADGFNRLGVATTTITASIDTTVYKTGTGSQKIEITTVPASARDHDIKVNVKKGVPTAIAVRLKTTLDAGWNFRVGSASGGTQYRNVQLKATDDFYIVNAAFIPTSDEVYITFFMNPATVNTLNAALWVDSIAVSYGINAPVPGAKQRVLPEYGATASRPTMPSIGQQFYDKTLSKPIWWDGAAWKDAAGTGV